jgi:hypothetical protein
VAGFGGTNGAADGHVGEERDLAEGGAIRVGDDLGLMLVRRSLKDAQATGKKDEEVAGKLALAYQDGTFSEMELVAPFEALELLIFQGGKDRDAAQELKELGGEDGGIGIKVCNCRHFAEFNVMSITT